MTVLMVTIGALVGAPTRYLTDRAIQERYGGAFPWGTLTVNIAASLLLGLLLGLHHQVSSPVLALVGTGFCGTLSTYSAFSYETLRLSETGDRRRAVTYVVTSLLLGIGAAAGGWALAAAAS